MSLECLKRRGYGVELVPTLHRDRLVFEILGKEVFRLNIRYLMFNHHCTFDEICRDAIEKIDEAVSRIYCLLNIPKLHTISSQDNIFNYE